MEEEPDLFASKEMKTDFEREAQWWRSKASNEETDLCDERINRLLRWREIERHLDGVKTIAEIGGATGVFSIPLAERGFTVTHVDFSDAALAIARDKAKDLAGIRFVEANAADLSVFGDESFDLVLNMDGAVSFCGTEAESAIRESCRICRKKIILTVTHRGWMIPVWIRETLPKFGTFVPAVKSMLERGYWHHDEHEQNKEITEKYFGTLSAFLPHDLKGLVEEAGFSVLRCSGLGSLINLCGEPVLDHLKEDDTALEAFLDLCDHFDREVMPDGPGQNSGLV